MTFGLLTIPTVNGQSGTERNINYDGEDIDTAVSIIQTHNDGYPIAGNPTPYDVGGDDAWLVMLEGENGNDGELPVTWILIGVGILIILIAIGGIPKLRGVFERPPI